jgi:hypothetical protein
MANEGKALDVGDIFPEVAFDIVSGGTVNLPAGFGKTWNVFLIYRGHW